MAEARLPAKLSRPRMSGVIDRARLFALLDTWREHPLLWVQGPPGAGKTTLVTTYLAHARSGSLWYRVDDGDADAATFFSYLSQAAATLKNKRAHNLPMLTPEYLLDVAGFARRYFRTLFAAMADGGALVLDSYENAAGAALDALLAIAASETPPGIRIMVASRTAPPAALASLAAKGSMALITWEDLQLSDEEGRAIAAAVPAREVGPVTSLLASSGGWAAGFVVMLEHARRGGVFDPAAPGAVQESLFAYFVNELFARADDQARDFLIRTAILPGFNGVEAAALCPDTDVQALLSRLYRRHFFIDRSNGPEPTYHYHALFREFLLAQGRARYPAAARVQLLNQAGLHLEAGGRDEDATALYTEAGNWQEAARLLCQMAPRLLREGRNARLDQGISALPAALVDQVPWLSFWLGMARMPFSPAASRGLFESAFTRFEASADPSASLLACSGVLQSYWYEWNDMLPVKPWGKAFHDLLQRPGVTLPPDIETQVLASLFGLLWVAEDHAELFDWAYERAIVLIEETRDPLQRINLANFAFFVGMARGEHVRWRRLLATIDPQLVRADLPPLQTGLWGLIKAWQLSQSGEFDNAFRALEIAEETLESNGVLVLSLLVSGHFVNAALNARDLARAERYIAKMGASLIPARTLDAANHDFMRCMLALAKGDVGTAIDFGRASVAKTTACGATFLSVECRTGLAYALLVAGDTAAALREAGQIIDYGRRTRYRVFEHAGLIVKAGVLLHIGDLQAGRDVLRAALAMGKADDFVVVFPWSPTPFLQQLYGKALEWGVEVSYVLSVIRRLGIPAAPDAGDLWPRPVKVFTLGRFEVLVDETPLEFGRKAPKRPLALLKLLIAQRGEAAAETAIDALWPDEEADAANNSLDAALHRLRKLLGHPESVTLQDGLLSLDRKRVWVDAIAFERDLDAGETGNAAADGPRAAALRRYHGHFLAADRAEPWSISARERLRSRFTRAAAAHGAALEAGNDFAGAAAHYARVIDIDDLIEAPYQGLMRCHLAQGQRSEGIAAFERLRQTLAAGLGLTPTAASAALHETLRRG